MKESKFNLTGEYDNNQVWVYNTLTTAAVLLNKKEYNRIFNLHMFSNYDETFLQLCDMGFF